MSNTKGMGPTTFRIANGICSAAAFFFTCGTIRPIYQTLLSSWPALVDMINRFGRASWTAVEPSWQEVLWIWVVVTMATGLIVEKDPFGKGQGISRFILPLATAVSALMLATVIYALPVPPYSKVFALVDLAWFFVLGGSYRLLLEVKRLRSDGRPRTITRDVVVGTEEGIERYLHHAGEELTADMEIAGFLSVEDQPQKKGSLEFMGHVSVLGDLLIHQPIDEVIVVLPEGRTPWLSDVLHDCDYFRVSVRVVCESTCGIALRDLTSVSMPTRVPAVALIPEEETLSGRLVCKRIVDVVASAAALILLLPLIIAIGIAIKITTPHLPIFYPWRVVGYRGRHFVGYKFTTMVADADEKKDSLAHLNEMQGPVFKIKDDPRVTPLGKFLRKYSLNELPQFWSVLVGDMSLVGPRPASPKELKGYQRWHKRKLSVRPGITCFWQVRGRNAICSFDDWVTMDLEYIQKRSTLTDLAILVQTVKVVLRGTGS